jgi:hypothetical protein
METQSKQTATSTSQSERLFSEDSQLSNSSAYYFLYCAICTGINKKDKLTEKQKNHMFRMLKENLGICFLNSLVFPLRAMIKQHEIHYNTGDYINRLKSYGKTYGCMSTPEEAFDVLSDQKSEVRDGILAMANNYLMLKQAVDSSQKEHFVNLCNESQQGMPDILLICGFLRDESLTLIRRSDIIRVTDQNGIEVDDKETAEIFYQEICSRKKAILNIEGVLPFLHHYSGIAEEERYPIRKAIALYKKTMTTFIEAMDTYSGPDIDKVEKLHIRDRGLFYKITVPIYLSTLKEKGQDVDSFIQRWENDYGSDSAWVLEAKRLFQEYSTPIEKPSSSTDKRNGKSQCWLKDEGLHTEGSMASYINDWCKFLKSKLDKFQGYDKNGENRIKLITRISCSMIYGVLEDIGWANEYLAGRYGKSFEYTMSLTSFDKDFRRQDMKDYMEMIAAFKKIMTAIKAEKKFSRHDNIEKRTINRRTVNDNDIIAEMRTEYVLLTPKNKFCGEFLSNNLMPFFETYRQLFHKIKESLKIKKIEFPYDINVNTLSEYVNRYNETTSQDNGSVDKEIREMFDEYEVAEYDDNDYDV